MSTLKIDIINPKAKKLLKGMADLNLISIKETGNNDFKTALKRLRGKTKAKPSLKEITKEVEAVRAKRYAR